MRRDDPAVAPPVEAVVPEHDQPRNVGEPTEPNCVSRGPPGDDRHLGTCTGYRPQRGGGPG